MIFLRRCEHRASVFSPHIAGFFYRKNGIDFMEIDLSDICVRDCKKCGSPLLWIEPVGGNLTLRCIQCNAFNDNISKEDAGIRERSHKSVHDAIPDRVKNAVRVRAGCKCELCGKLAADSALHTAHLVSVDDGLRFGIPTHILNSEENLACFCEQCNQEMGTETVPLRLAVIILAVRTRNKNSNFQQIINSAAQGGNP